MSEYLKMLRTTLGDMFEHCPTNFELRNGVWYYWLIDTPKERAMGLLTIGYKPQWLERKLEEYGVMVLSTNSYPVRGRTPSRGHATVMSIRLPQRQDVMKGGRK